MVTFTSTRTDDPSAAGLLARYFAERELTFPSAQGTYSVTPPDPERFVPPLGDFVVAHRYVEPIGCGGVRRIEDALGQGGAQVRRFEIKHLFVAPAGRGFGLGRMLLAEVERRAVALGAQTLVLDTNESLAAAGGLYRTSGYSEVAPYNDNPNATHWYAKVVAER